MAQGGAGKNDFFLRFGSDAGEFSEQLVGDLTKARNVVKLLTTDLRNLDKQANGSRAKLQGALGADLAARGNGGGGGSLPASGGGDPSGFYQDLNGIGSTLREFNSELTGVVGRIVAQLGKVPEAAKEYQTKLKQQISQQLAYRDRLVNENNVFTTAANGGFKPQPKLPNLTQAALSQTRPVVAPPTSGGGTRVGAGVITHGFDRVVTKLEAIEGILKAGIPTRPGGGPTPKVGLTSPAATSAAEANAAAPTTAKIKQASASEQERLAALDAQIAANAQSMERIAAAIKLVGGGVAEQMQGALADTQKGMQGLKAQRAALEREITGLSKDDQSAARRTAAQEARAALPAQDEATYNDILRKRQVLDQTSDRAGLAAAATGRGAGKLSREDLQAMAQVMREVGFAPQGINSKSNKAQLASSISDARDQFGLVNGDQLPPELTLGRKVVAGKVSDYMHSLLGDLNAAAVRTVEQAQASATMSAFGLSGGSGYKIDENGQVRVKGNAGLKVSPGLPSQAFGPDALHVQSAAEVLDARRSGLQAVGFEEAKRNATNPQFNPYDPKLYDEISKGNDGGDVAKVAMHALAQLKESTKALDEMYDEWKVFDAAIEANAQFIERAQHRLAADPSTLNAEQRGKLATDPANLAAAQESQARLQQHLADPRFAGLGDVFSSPGYIQGRTTRYAQQSANDEAREEAAARRHYSDVSLQGASGQAIAGTRLATGTAQTYVRNIPGARYNDNLNRYEFTEDRPEDQRNLDELNRHSQSYNASLQKEGSIQAYDPDNLAGLEKARAKTENKATAFLNELSKVFGITPSFESVVGRAPTSDAAVRAEAAREAQRQDIQERATRKFGPQTQAEAQAEASGGSGGSGNKGGSGSGSGSGSDGGDNSRAGRNQLLRQILDEIKGLHTTIKARRGGFGKADKDPTVEEGGTRETSTQRRKREVVAATSGTDEEAMAAIAQQRARLSYVTPTTVDKAHEQALVINEQMNNRVATSIRKSSAASRDQVRSQQELSTAYAHLDSDARREVENLRQLVKAGTDEEAIVRAQARAYAAMDAALAKAGAPSANRRQQIRGVLSDAQGTKVSGTEVDAVARQAKSINGFETVDKTFAAGVPPQGIFGEQSAFTKAMFGNSGFWSRVMASTGTFVVRNFTAGFVFGLTNALGSVIKEAINTEQTFVRVSNAFEATGKSADGLRGELLKVSTDYGTSLNDVYDIAASLTGLFSSGKEVAGATRVVAQLERISDGALNAQEAVAVLSSITGAFGTGDSVAGIEHIADVLTSIQNNIGANVELTSEGIARVSGQAKQLGLTLEDTGVYVAQIGKLTGQQGSAAGDQFSRILAALQTGRGKNSITTAFSDAADAGKITQGAAVQIQGQFNKGDYGGAIKTLMENWNNLTKAQKSNIATSIAGQRQAAAFAALMHNTSATLNDVARAHDSAGVAADRNAKLSHTLNGEISRITTNLQGLAYNLLQLGLLDFLGLILQTINTVLGGVNQLVAKFNEMTKSGLGSFFKNAAVGLIGFGLAVNLVLRSVRGFRASIAEMKLGSALAAATGRGSAAGAEVQAVGAGRLVQPRVGTGGAFGFLRGPVGAIQRSDSVVGRPLAATGNVAGRVLSTPFNAVGGGLTKLGTRLDASAAQVANETSLRARLIGGLGRDVGRVGRGVTGVGTATGAVLGGEGSAYYGGVAQRLQQRATTNRMRALGASLNEEGLKPLPTQGPLTLANAQAIHAGTGGVSTGIETTTRSAAAYNALAKTQEIAAGGATKLSKALGAVTASGLTVDAAMIAVSLAIGAMVEEAHRQSELGKTAATAYKEEFGADKGLTSDQAKAKNYFGPASDAVADDKGPGWFSTGLAYLTGGNKGVERARGYEEVPGTGSFSTNPTLAAYGYRQAQDLTSKTVSSIDDASKQGASSSDILTIQAKASKEIDRLAKKAIKDKSLSGAQRANALAELEQAAKAINATAANAAAVADGISKQGQITADQGQAMSDLMTTGTSLAGRGTTIGGLDLSGYANEQLNQTGQKQGDSLYDGLQQVASGGLDALGLVKENQKELKARIKSMYDQWQIALKGDPSGDDTKAKYQALQQLITDYTSGQDKIFQQTLADNQEAAKLLENSGNYKKASAALGPAIALQQQKIADSQPKAVETPGGGLQVAGGRIKRLPQTAGQKKNEEDARTQLADLFSAQTADLQTAATKPYDLQIAQEQGSQAKANTTAQRAAVVLALLKKRYKDTGGLGVTQAQIVQAQQDYYSAQQAAGQAADDHTIAQMSLAAAGLWNSADQAAAAQAISLQQLIEAQKRYGKNSTEALNAQTAYVQSQKATTQANDAIADATRQTAIAAIPQGDATRVARANIASAQAGVAEAQKYGHNSTEYQGALATLYGAQQQAMAAQGAVTQAQASLAQAYAEARGDSVAAARAAERGAQQALALARKQSGGANSADVINAKAAAVSARAATRDAILQDRLDTIDFNLEMGKTTQSSAIAAMQQILRTANLTKQQRRDLLLKIKGMKDEIVDGPWNFDDITLPTPYQMRRYVAAQAMNAAQKNQTPYHDSTSLSLQDRPSQGGEAGSINDNRTVYIDGADTAKVRAILEDVLGKSVKTRTTQGRRR